MYVWLQTRPAKRSPLATVGSGKPKGNASLRAVLKQHPRPTLCGRKGVLGLRPAAGGFDPGPQVSHFFFSSRFDRTKYGNKAKALQT